MKLSNLIKSLRQTQAENRKIIDSFMNTKANARAITNGEDTLYDKDIQRISTYKEKALEELERSVKELQQLNIEIDQYIKEITR